MGGKNILFTIGKQEKNVLQIAEAPLTHDTQHICYSKYLTLNHTKRHTAIHLTYHLWCIKTGVVVKKMAAGDVSVISSFYQGSPSACHKPDLARTLKLNALCVDVQQYQEKS